MMKPLSYFLFVVLWLNELAPVIELPKRENHAQKEAVRQKRCANRLIDIEAQMEFVRDRVSDLVEKAHMDDVLSVIAQAHTAAKEMLELKSKRTSIETYLASLTSPKARRRGHKIHKKGTPQKVLKEAA